MWRFMSLHFPDSSMPTNNDAVINEVSKIKSATCLILMILFTTFLTIASIYEHATNVCISFLLVLTIIFLAYSVSMKNSFLRYMSDVEPSPVSQNIWTTIVESRSQNNSSESEDHTFKDPPSYDSIMQGTRKWSVPPPPYSTVILNETISAEQNNVLHSTDERVVTNDNQIVIDVRRFRNS